MGSNLTNDRNKTFDSYIRTEVDDINCLCLNIVDRVMSRTKDMEELCFFSEYLLSKRKDLDVAEVIEIEAKVMAERGWRTGRSKLC